ncbi:DJ-1/PfpI family protein [Aureimonas altamirensis]|uniref:DJ-1/PfpI family protein n=1 Tax=Aureimonas altamirensis TaxID=370622 RepID=UPI0025558683|nr:DJ-1/PfpI family protein [Aureimonas altamirensis]
MLNRRDVLIGLAYGSLFAPQLLRPASAADGKSNDWQDEFANLPGVKLTGDEDIAMLLYPGFTALDLVGPYHFFAGMMGARVHLVTNQPSLLPVKSDMGLAVEPTVTLADCPRSLTILFTPGGTDGTLAAARDPATIDFIRDRAPHTQHITSVCTGALILGATGLLRGKRATTHWSVLPLLSQFGAEPVDARVVQDGELITGAGVSAGLDFGLSIVARLRGQPYAAASMLTAEYHPEPPFEGGTLSTTPREVSQSMKALFASFVEEAKKLRVAD